MTRSLFLFPQDNGPDEAPPGVQVSWADWDFPGMPSLLDVPGLKGFHRIRDGWGWGEGADRKSLETPTTHPVLVSGLRRHTEPITPHALEHTAIACSEHLFFNGLCWKRLEGSGRAKAGTRQGPLLPAKQELKPSRAIPGPGLSQQSLESILKHVTYLYLSAKDGH